MACWVLQCSLPDPVDQVGLNVDGAPVHERRRDEQTITITVSALVSRDWMPSSIARPGQVRWRERGAGGHHQREQHDQDSPAVRPQQAEPSLRSLRMRRSSPRIKRQTRLTAHHLALGVLAREEDLVRKSPLGDLAVERRLGHQLHMRPACGDAALLEHHDLVGERDRRQPVRDHERGPPRHHLGKRGLDVALCRGVDARGRVVEDQDARLCQQRTRDGYALALAAGGVGPRSPTSVSRPSGASPAAPRAPRLGGRADLLVVGLGPGVGDVVTQAGREGGRRRP